MRNWTKEELETVIVVSELDDRAFVYTNRHYDIQKYRKLASEREEANVVKDEGDAIEISVPIKWIKVRPPRAVSEKQREAGRRMAGLRRQKNEGQ